MSLESNIHHITQLIQQTELACQRAPGSVMLLAVSKQQSAEAVRQAFQFGLHDFAENYFQEAEDKIKCLHDLPLSWHFIGQLQSNKTKGIATLFDWVHSVDRYSIATLLNKHRPENTTPLNICLQINLTGEASKAGIPPEEAAELAFLINRLPHLALRGLMTIPPPAQSEYEQFDLFKQMNQLLGSINQQLNLQMDVLSMGMSDDLVPAIRAGATIVRVGRGIFGERIRSTHAH